MASNNYPTEILLSSQLSQLSWLFLPLLDSPHSFNWQGWVVEHSHHATMGGWVDEKKTNKSIQLLRAMKGITRNSSLEFKDTSAVLFLSMSLGSLVRK